MTTCSRCATDLGRMQVLDDLGDHHGAIEVGNQVLRTLPDVRGDGATSALIEAAVLCNLGVAHSFLGDHETSLRLYAQAETAYATLDQPVQVAQQQANQGIEFLALGRAREARIVLSTARDEFARAGDHLWGAKCAAHLADAHQHLGELVDAIRVLDEAGSETGQSWARPPSCCACTSSRRAPTCRPDCWMSRSPKRIGRSPRPASSRWRTTRGSPG